MIKQIISGVCISIVIGLSIYFIVIFFQNYDFVFLFCGVGIPIIALMISSQYFAGNSFTVSILIGSLIGVHYFNTPYNYLSGSLGAYFFLFKFIRWGSSLTGNYIDKGLLLGQDAKFISTVLNNEWFKDKKPNEVTINDLLNQDFYNTSVTPIIEILILNNRTQFESSTYTKDKLLKIHAIGTMYGLPCPIIKTQEAFISTGTQLLLNIFANIKAINKSEVNTDHDNVHIQSVDILKRNSKNQFGEVTQEDIEVLMNRN
jgi:hypothetical protein